MDDDNEMETEGTDWSLMDLPQEVIHMLLSYLPFKDLMKCRRVCTSMLNLIDNDRRLLADARLEMVWPTRRNHSHINKAAQTGNFEAQVKLATTYIYDGAQAEPLGFDFEMRWQEADKLFEAMDNRLSPSSPPISWIFYRPPYRSFNECCKINIFRAIGMKAASQRSLQEKFNCRDLYVVSRLLVLMPHKCPVSLVKTYLKMILKKIASPHASILLFRIEREESGCHKPDKARELRQILTNCPKSYEAQLALASEYAEGRYGFMSEDLTGSFVGKVFAESSRGFRHCSQATRNTSFEKNRLVVVSWMIEVADEHYLKPNVLHLAVDIFDRFMSRQSVNSWQLQLVGITALAISTRLLDVVPLTITWAAWLTDNTYHYMDVVRMKGQMVATLRGQLETWKALDYVTLLVKKSGCNQVVKFMVQYLLEKAHLLLDLRCEPQALVAAACWQLAFVILKRSDECWPKSLQQWTGFSSEFVAKTTMILYQNIFMMKRGKKMTEAWKMARAKYSFDKFLCVSTMHWREPSFFEVCQLGHHENEHHHHHQQLPQPQRRPRSAVKHFCCAAAKRKLSRGNRRRLRERKFYERIKSNDNDAK